MNKRIVFATGIYPPEIGGPATYAALMEAELIRRGWVVEVLPFRSVRAWPTGIRHALYAWKLWRASRGAAVVFAQDTVSVGLPAALVARLRRAPLVLRVPGEFAWGQAVQRFGVQDGIDTFQTKTYGWRVEMLRSIQRFVARSATRVIAPSQYFATLVQGWLLPDAPRVRHIYNGVALPANLRLATFDRLTIVTAARLVPWKGIDRLIRLLPSCSQEAQLLVIGDGPDRTRLEGIARDAGVEDRVKFTGQLPREELLAEVAGADLFVLASSFESFSFQLVEAMMLGKAIVAQRSGNIEEMIRSGQSGVLVEPENDEALVEAIQSLLMHPDQREALGRAAKQASATFSVQATGDALEALLREILPV